MTDCTYVIQLNCMYTVTKVFKALHLCIGIYLKRTYKLNTIRVHRCEIRCSLQQNCFLILFHSSSSALSSIKTSSQEKKITTDLLKDGTLVLYQTVTQ